MFSNLFFIHSRSHRVKDFISSFCGIYVELVVKNTEELWGITQKELGSTRDVSLASLCRHILPRICTHVIPNGTLERER
jgi:hypothetical protein